jgi:competence protein ComEC
MKKGIFVFFISLVILVFLVVFNLFKFDDQKVHIVVCDVGQGDAIFITTPKKSQILVDGGPDKTVLDCVANNMPFWDRSIDAVILTHPHADHLTGLLDVIERYSVNGFYTQDTKTDSDLYKLLEAKLANKNMSAKELPASSSFKEESGFKFQILWPKPSENKKAEQNASKINLNESSIVGKITFGNFSMLVTGDSGKEVMEEIANEVGDIDVLKFPHHGSKTGVSDRFLKIISPEIALISVGEKNRYGHPSKISLDLLDRHRIKIIRTDKNGEIEIISDGKTYSIKSSKN